MIIVPQKLDPEVHDFFDYNPEYRYYSSVMSLEKDVGPMVASRVMWAIYLTEHPESVFYGQAREDRRREIEKNFLNNTEFDWDYYDYVIEDFPNITLDTDGRRFKKLNDKFDELLEELDEVDFKTASLFFTKVESAYKGLTIVRQQYEKEKQKKGSGDKKGAGKFS